MRLITARTLEDFAGAHASSREALATWRTIVQSSHWHDAGSVRDVIGPSARHIGKNRFVFEIKGNDFRLVAEVRFADLSKKFNGIVYVQFIGSHAEYDRIDALTVTRSAP